MSVRVLVFDIAIDTNLLMDFKYIRVLTLYIRTHYRVSMYHIVVLLFRYIGDAISCIFEYVLASKSKMYLIEIHSFFIIFSFFLFVLKTENKWFHSSIKNNHNAILWCDMTMNAICLFLIRHWNDFRFGLIYSFILRLSIIIFIFFSVCIHTSLRRIRFWNRLINKMCIYSVSVSPFCVRTRSTRLLLCCILLFYYYYYFPIYVHSVHHSSTHKMFRQNKQTNKKKQINFSMYKICKKKIFFFALFEVKHD